MKKKLSVALGAAAGLALAIVLLYLAVISFAFAKDNYPQEGQYADMADAMIVYLQGDTDDLPDTLFTERERLHMVDVQGLFAGARALATWLAWGGLALCAAAWLAGGRRALGKGLLIGLAVFLAFIACMGLWALIDFTGWFTAMHELVFTNDLWLLDPAESALINMLPETFFSSAVATIALRFALGLAVLALAAVALLRFVPRRRDYGISG